MAMKSNGELRKRLQRLARGEPVDKPGQGTQPINPEDMKCLAHAVGKLIAKKDVTSDRLILPPSCVLPLL